MAEQFRTPPSVDPTLAQDIKSLTDVVVVNYQNIAEKLIYAGIRDGGVIPKISTPALIQLVDRMIIPSVLKNEGGWGDDPADSGGPTMRGVILTTLRSNFDNIFVNTDVPAVATAAKSWNTRHPNWKTEDSLGKQFLYSFCGEPKVAALFVYLFMSSKSNRYPIAVMSEDPWLGYFFFECCWMTGAGVYTNAYADFDKVAKKYGWSGGNWANYIASLGDKTPQMAGEVLLARFNHITKISQPGTKNEKFREGWLNRLLQSDDSSLMYLVKINEMFNLNSKGMFTLSTAELEHLRRKAEIYKTFNIEIPG